MKKIVHGVLAIILIIASSTLHAITVHVVPMAEQNGQWAALLNVPYPVPKPGNWYFFSAKVPSEQQPLVVAKEILKNNSYGFYTLPDDAITRQEGENIFYFFLARHKPQLELNDIAAKAWSRPVEAFAWITKEEINDEKEPYTLISEKSGSYDNLIDIKYPVQKEVFANLKKYVPGVIKEMKETLSGSLNELKNSLNALKTALRQK